jgi:spermidine synthase
MPELLISEHNGLRTLHFGSEWVQGRMQIRKPAELVIPYTQEMTAALLFVPPPQTIYIAGLGVGALPRWAFHHWNEHIKRMDVVELRSDVIALASHAFPLPIDDARLRIEENDAAAAIAMRGASTFDWVWVDCYDGRGRVGALESSEFYEAAHRALKKRGVFVANMWSDVSRYRPGLKRLHKVFGDNVLLLPSIETENVTVIASKTAFPLLGTPALHARATALQRAHGMPFDRWLQRMSFIRAAL